MKIVKVKFDDLLRIVSESIENQLGDNAPNQNKIQVSSENLANLLNKFGISTSESINELTIQSEALNLNIDEAGVMAFKKDITDYMLRLGEMSVGIKNWYLDAHNFIVSSLGDDAALFLMLVGATSPRRSIKVNLIAAAKIYLAFKRDLLKNRDQVLGFVGDASLKFGVTNTVDDIPYNLEFIQVGNELSGIMSNMKNIKKIFSIYMSHNEKLSMNDAIEWMKSSMSFDTLAGKAKKRVLHKDNAISSHKVFNFTMNLLDPNNQSHEYEYVTIDTHMIRYFIPDARDGSKLADYQSKIFNNTKGLYYLLSNLTQQISNEIKKDIPSINSNQTQALIWFIARERYGSEARTDNENGGTYEKEFNILHSTIQEEQYFIGDMDNMTRVMNFIDKNFNEVLKDVNNNNASPETEMSDEAPF